MKKKIFYPFILFLFLLGFNIPVFAEQSEFPDSLENKEYIFDTAHILTETECETLEESARKWSEAYNCGIYLITVEDFTTSTGETDAKEAAKDFYLQYSLGVGEDSSGVLLMMSMSDRKMALIAKGHGNHAITDKRNQKIRDDIKKDFKTDDWYSGFTKYVDHTASYLGNKITFSERMSGIAACFLISLIVALTIMFFLKNQLKSVALKTQAGSYITADGLTLTNRKDTYLYTNESRVYSPENTSDDNSTTIDSDGFSGSSDDF